MQLYLLKFWKYIFALQDQLWFYNSFQILDGDVAHERHGLRAAVDGLGPGHAAALALRHDAAGEPPDVLHHAHVTPRHHI